MIKQDRLIYVYGAGGHTSLVTGEMFFRIGGLANIYPITEFGLSALRQARKFIALERAEGLGSALITASGIGVASSHWQDETPADAPVRAAGRENLRDIVDIYIDDCNTVDDAAVVLAGMEVKAGALSGSGRFAIAHLIEIAAMEESLKNGIVPPVWANANTPEGAARNTALMEKYEKRIPML